MIVAATVREAREELAHERVLARVDLDPVAAGGDRSRRGPSEPVV